jgi:integration host factor subunit beta
MTRADLIDRLAYLHPQLQTKDVEMAVRLILDAMSATLYRGGRIEIRGFGSFALNYRPPRLGRNPKTGAKVEVPAKYSPHFKAGLELRKRVDYD